MVLADARAFAVSLGLTQQHEIKSTGNVDHAKALQNCIDGSATCVQALPVVHMYMLRVHQLVSPPVT